MDSGLTLSNAAALIGEETAFIKQHEVFVVGSTACAWKHVADAVVVVVSLSASSSLGLLLRHSLLGGEVGHKDLLVFKHLSLQILKAVVLLHFVRLSLSNSCSLISLCHCWSLLFGVVQTFALVLEEKTALRSSHSTLASRAFPPGCLVGSVQRFVHFV